MNSVTQSLHMQVTDIKHKITKLAAILAISVTLSACPKPAVINCEPKPPTLPPELIQVPARRCQFKDCFHNPDNPKATSCLIQSTETDFLLDFQQQKRYCEAIRAYFD